MGIVSKIAPFLSGFWIKFGIIIAIIVGLIAFGGKMGYDMRDRAALKQQQKIEQQAITDANNYKKQITDLLVKQHGLSSQLDQALQENQNVVTKTITQTIIKEVHDHPSDYQCAIPSSGMQLISSQAQQLNNLRAGSDSKH